MAERHDDDQFDSEATGGGTTAVIAETKPAPPRLDRMPQWKVLLHNDDVNDMEYVVDAIVQVTSLRRQDALLRMLEAHDRGLSLLVMTHKEHAELIEDQLASKRLTVTIEAD